jgi:hypothetical protein
MPLDLDLGVDLQIADDPAVVGAPTATDTGFLIHNMTQEESPETVERVKSPAHGRELYPDEPALHAAIDGFFNVGGSRLYVNKLDTDEVAAANAFDPTLGPGQLMAPQVVTTADQVSLRDWAWDNNRIYIAQAPDGASDAAVETLAAALINEEGGRFSMIEGDTLLIPGLAPGTTRDVAASVIKAGLMARSDRITGNPNLAAAGNHTPGAAGQADYVLGIKAERSTTSQKALAQAQVNSFRTVNGKVRSYGYWTLADLDALPHWWDVGGSRTVMAVRAREQAVAEELMFGQVAADGAFLDKYKGALSGVLAEFQRMGAIYGSELDPGYYVDTGVGVNPRENVAKGLITAVITLRTSPFAAALKIILTRRAIADQVV